MQIATSVSGKTFPKSLPGIQVDGKEVTFWRTVETSVNSLNYFTDGTVSDEYFIVEGYLANSDEKIRCTY